MEIGERAKDKISGRIGTIKSGPTTTEHKNDKLKVDREEVQYMLESDNGHKFIVQEKNLEEITSK